MERNQADDQGNEAGEGRTTSTTFPTKNVTRIMRHALRHYPRARINGDARDAVGRCAAEFASVVTAVAAGVRQEQKKVTLNGDDLITAMRRIGYGHYAAPLAEYLRLYREFEGTVGRGRQPSGQRLAAVLRVGAQQVPAGAAGTLEMLPPPPPPPPPPPSGFALGDQPPRNVTELRLYSAPAAAVATAEMLPPPSRSRFAFGQLPCDVTELGLHTDVYAVWSGATAASTSQMPPARDDDDE